MKRSSSMTAIFALGAGSGCVGGVIGRQAIPQPPGADISWQAGVEYGTVAPARKRARCARAEGLQSRAGVPIVQSEEHTSELQSRLHLVCRLLLEKKNLFLFTPLCLLSHWA